VDAYAQLIQQKFDARNLLHYNILKMFCKHQGIYFSIIKIYCRILCARIIVLRNAICYCAAASWQTRALCLPGMGARAWIPPRTALWFVTTDDTGYIWVNEND
jgi:hypothetical protein